jgi:hypothetical protein
MVCKGSITHSKDKVQIISQLHGKRKISNITTAETNMIINFRTLRPSTKNGTMQVYDELFNTYQQAERLHVRMRVAKETTIEKTVVETQTNNIKLPIKLFFFSGL